jgi:hypothetical protein
MLSQRDAAAAPSTWQRSQRHITGISLLVGSAQRKHVGSRDLRGGHRERPACDEP